MGANRIINRTCADCGTDFAISKKFQDYIEENNLKLPKRCKKCRDARKNQYKELECVECGKTFVITLNEHNFYEERGLSEPKRCHECRSARHERAEDTKPE